MMTDREALDARRATGCQYDAGVCACPAPPYVYAGCRAARRADLAAVLGVPADLVDAPPRRPPAAPYVVDLATGGVTGGPAAGTVQHYDRLAGDLTAHPFDPAGCDQCADLAVLGYPDALP